MKMSLNELSTAFKRSFRGLGVPLGDYEDAAKMIVWLEAHGLDGLSEVKRALPYIINKACEPMKVINDENSLMTLDGGGNSVVNCGGQAVDLAYVKAKQQGMGEIILTHCHNRKLIMERISNCGHRGMSCFAYWHNGSTTLSEHIVTIAAGDNCPNYSYSAIDSSDTLEKQSIYICCAEDFTALQAHAAHTMKPSVTQQHIVTAQQMTEAYITALDNGIDVEDDLVDTVEELIKNILVASTEQSRLGAGA